MRSSIAATDRHQVNFLFSFAHRTTRGNAQFIVHIYKQDHNLSYDNFNYTENSPLNPPPASQAINPTS